MWKKFATKYDLLFTVLIMSKSGSEQQHSNKLEAIQILSATQHEGKLLAKFSFLMKILWIFDRYQYSKTFDNSCACTNIKKTVLL